MPALGGCLSASPEIEKPRTRCNRTALVPQSRTDTDGHLGSDGSYLTLPEGVFAVKCSEKRS